MNPQDPTRVDPTADPARVSGPRRPTLAAALRLPPGHVELRGRRLGGYVVARQLARGGMGAVFEALPVGGGPPVALKVHLAGAAASDTQRRRFEREARLAAALAHPGLVPVLASGEEEGLPWLAMELVPGGTLEEALRVGLPRERLVQLVAEVARAVGHAHAHGVVHRDLKPSNVLLDARTGRPRVTDFGIARDLGLGSSLTRSGVALGTPLYMAPEQAAGRPISAAVDVYALGAILYHGLTDQPPLAEASASTLAFYAALAERMPEPPSRKREGIAPALDAICLRALAKDPAARYPDANALAAALEAYLAGAVEPPRRRKAAAAGVLLGLGGALAVALVAARGPDAAREVAAEPAAAPAAPVEPAPEVAPVHELILQPGPLEGEDAHVRGDGLYLNDNFGVTPYLMVGDRPSGQPGLYRAYLRFDLGRVPADAALERATLELWLRDAGDLERPLELVALAVARHGPRWVEGAGGFDRTLDGICWAGAHPGAPRPYGYSGRPELTQPDVEHDPAPPAARVEPDSAGRWLAFDVTPHVARWLLDPPGNRGLRLAARREAAPHDQGWVLLSSSEAAEADRRPRLVLRYRGGAPGPALDEAALAEARRERAARWLERAALLAPGEEALRAVTQACLEAPHWGEAFLARARVAAALRWHEAEADLARALEAPLPARASEVHRVRGAHRLALGQAREALEDAARLRALEPDGVDGPLLEGWARLALGDVAGAQQVAREALGRAPGDARLLELAQRAGLR